MQYLTIFSIYFYFLLYFGFSYPKTNIVHPVKIVYDVPRIYQSFWNNGNFSACFVYRFHFNVSHFDCRKYKILYNKHGNVSMKKKYLYSCNILCVKYRIGIIADIWMEIKWYSFSIFLVHRLTIQHTDKNMYKVIEYKR